MYETAMGKLQGGTTIQTVANVEERTRSFRRTVIFSTALDPHDSSTPPPPPGRLAELREVGERRRSPRAGMGMGTDGENGSKVDVPLLFSPSARRLKRAELFPCPFSRLRRRGVQRTGEVGKRLEDADCRGCDGLGHDA